MLRNLNIFNYSIPTYLFFNIVAFLVNAIILLKYSKTIKMNTRKCIICFFIILKFFANIFFIKY